MYSKRKVVLELNSNTNFVYSLGRSDISDRLFFFDGICYTEEDSKKVKKKGADV